MRVLVQTRSIRFPFPLPPPLPTGRECSCRLDPHATHARRRTGCKEFLERRGALAEEKAEQRRVEQQPVEGVQARTERPRPRSARGGTLTTTLSNQRLYLALYLAHALRRRRRGCDRR